MEVKDGKKPEELLCIKGAEKEDEERKIEEAEGYATQGAQKEYCIAHSRKAFSIFNFYGVT